MNIHLSHLISTRFGFNLHMCLRFQKELLCNMQIAKRQKLSYRKGCICYTNNIIFGFAGMAGAIIIGFLLLGGAAAKQQWNVTIVPAVTVHMNDIVQIPFNVSGIDPISKLLEPSSNSDIAKTNFHLYTRNITFITGILNITGVFLGRTKLMFTLLDAKVNNCKVTS